jgi:hypothetical protein
MMLLCLKRSPRKGGEKLPGGTKSEAKDKRETVGVSIFSPHVFDLLGGHITPEEYLDTLMEEAKRRVEEIKREAVAGA